MSSPPKVGIGELSSKATPNSPRPPKCPTTGAVRRWMRGDLWSALVEEEATFLESAAASAVHSPFGVHSRNDNTNRARMTKLFIGSLDAILSDCGDQNFFQDTVMLSDHFASPLYQDSVLRPLAVAPF